MREFIVTGSYQTMAGNMGVFRIEVEAPDVESAMDSAAKRIKSDRRRRYCGKLDMSCSA